MSYANDMPATTTSDRTLVATLRPAVLRLSRALRQQRIDETLSQGQMAALGTLYNHGPLTPRELAAREKVQPPSMTRIIAALEEAGYVTRTPHPTDGRQVLVAVTGTAVELIKQNRRKRDAWLAPRIAALTEEERRVLRDAAPILERLATL